MKNSGAFASALCRDCTSLQPAPARQQSPSTGTGIGTRNHEGQPALKAEVLRSVEYKKRQVVSEDEVKNFILDMLLWNVKAVLDCMYVSLTAISMKVFLKKGNFLGVLCSYISIQMNMK